MKKKILVIDDEEILTKTFARLLEKQGYEVLFALRADDAFAIAESEDFDLILSDIRIPGKNGVEIVKEMQAIFLKEGRAMPPVIFITGFADELLEEQAKQLNPVAYLSKPFDAIKLLKTIENRVGV